MIDVPITVVLRDLTTDETREYHTTYPRAHDETYEDWKEGIYYQWSDGNFGCDCNRHMFWREAGGEKPLGYETCGGSRFRIVSITVDATGKRIYSEEIG